MREAGVDPDIVTYNTALSACERAADLEAALSIRRQMERAGVAADEVRLASAGRWNGRGSLRTRCA
eukprot:4804013-Pyramimonas_sp.AAC.1